MTHARALIEAMVACVAPKPGKAIDDPACSAVGLLRATHDDLVKQRTPTPAQ